MDTSIEFYETSLLRFAEMLIAANPSLATSHEALVSSADHLARLFTACRESFVREQGKGGSCGTSQNS
ncbi:MAG: hypothetical protein PHO57_02960 [Acidithiobacillus sp.]|jgi:hypothetical protein|nr:hypothetical protein [Acidithiobacillus sp.]